MRRALEDPAQADETFAQIIDASEQLDIAVRDAGVEDCEAPLEESASA